MVIVEVIAYGDFGMTHTTGVWVHMGMTRQEFDPATLGDFENDRDCEKAERALKQAGFTKMKTVAIEVGGNL